MSADAALRHGTGRHLAKAELGGVFNRGGAAEANDVSILEALR